MAIIGALPVTLTNGTTADATQVMADFNSIVSQVNANGAQLAGGNAFTGAQTIAGDAIVTLSATQTVSGKTLTGPNGSPSAPTYSFSASTGTGISSPSTNTLAIGTNSAYSLYFDANQNIGFKTLTSAWGVLSAIETNAGAVAYLGTISMYFMQNVYYNGANYVYKNNGAGSLYIQNSGAHQWFSFASGTSGASATNVLYLTLDAGGRLFGTAIHNNATLPTGTTNQYIASGTYTPTLTAVTNISADSVPGTWQWIRVGNVVNVSGYMSVTPTTASAWGLRATLPISSATTNLAGCVQGLQVSGSSASVLSGSGQAVIGATATSTGSSTVVVSFTYEVA